MKNAAARSLLLKNGVVMVRASIRVTYQNSIGKQVDRAAQKVGRRAAYI
jgi:hypothetical protein